MKEALQKRKDNGHSELEIIQIDTFYKHAQVMTPKITLPSRVDLFEDPQEDHIGLKIF
jgi:hypothetical protein